jgi:hypothetical protein
MNSGINIQMASTVKAQKNVDEWLGARPNMMNNRQTNVAKYDTNFPQVENSLVTLQKKHRTTHFNNNDAHFH